MLTMFFEAFSKLEFIDRNLTQVSSRSVTDDIRIRYCTSQCRRRDQQASPSCPGLVCRSEGGFGVGVNFSAQNPAQLFQGLHNGIPIGVRVDQKIPTIGGAEILNCWGSGVVWLLRSMIETRFGDSTRFAVADLGKPLYPNGHV